MTEQLKTLNDMMESHCEGCEDGDSYDDPVLKHELRVEAIKWIKELAKTGLDLSKIEKIDEENYNYAGSSAGLPESNEQMVAMGVICTFMRFFNLSEEDLAK